MRAFLMRIVLFLSVVGISFIAILLSVDGYDDDYYYRFTSPKQQSMIIGTSRAAQGLLPSVIGEGLNQSIFNFAFTRSISPYTKVYVDRILEKLDRTSRAGVFILAIDCWSIADASKADVTKTDPLLENVWYVDRWPNLPYLINRFSGRYYEILKRDTNTYLHQDGWLEVNVPMDEESIAIRTAKKLGHYRKMRNDLSISSDFASNLGSLVDSLQRFGEVYLVRLPVSPEMRMIESGYELSFMRSIQETVKASDGYLDLKSLDDSMLYTDGNHLHSSSAADISKRVCEWIKQKRTQRGQI
jgi:hypothetical protein